MKIQLSRLRWLAFILLALIVSVFNVFHRDSEERKRNSAKMRATLQSNLDNIQQTTELLGTALIPWSPDFVPLRADISPKKWIYTNHTVNGKEFFARYALIQRVDGDTITLSIPPRLQARPTVQNADWRRQREENSRMMAPWITQEVAKNTLVSYFLRSNE